MATTINPAVSGVSYRRWLVHVGLYLIGLTAGTLITYAAARGLYLGLRRVSPTSWTVAALPLMSLVILRDLGLSVPVPYPSRRQVPEWLRRMTPPGFTALVYGGQLGIGFLTRFTYSTHLAFILLLALMPMSWIAILAVVAFAAAKSIVVLTSIAGTSYTEFERRLLRRHRSRPLGLRLLGIANAAVAVAVASVLVVNLR